MHMGQLKSRYQVDIDILSSRRNILNQLISLGNPVGNVSRAIQIAAALTTDVVSSHPNGKNFPFIIKILILSFSFL